METLPSLNRIQFTFINTKYKFTQKNVKKWLIEVAKKEKYTINYLSYIMCSNEKITEINIQYLKHNYPTDIITFDLSDQKYIIESEIYIGLDIIKQNAREHNSKIPDEFLRVLIHGILHLVGFDDKTNSQKREMRQNEEKYIELYKSMFHVKQIKI